MQTQEKILIIDDSKANLEVIGSMLAPEYKVEKALNGEAGLKKAGEFKPGIVLLDIMMPGMDGYEVCSKLRLQPGLTKTKIILVSAKGTVADRLKGYEVGADDYIQKPFDENELLAKMTVFKRLNETERAGARLNRLLLMRQQDIPNLLWECHPDLRFNFVDENCFPLLGYTPQEMINQPITDFLLQGKSEFESSFQNKSQTSTPGIRGVPFQFRKKNGEAITLQVFADGQLDDKQHLIGISGILRDMSAFTQLLANDAAGCKSVSLRIDSDYNIIFNDETTRNLFCLIASGKENCNVASYLRDATVINLLQFAFNQSEDVPFPVELSLPDKQGVAHNFTVELTFCATGPYLEGCLLPSSARDQLEFVSQRIENQNQKIKDQEESLKNAVIIDDDTRRHILQDAHNLSAEILNLAKQLNPFSYPDDGIFNLEEFKQFIAVKNLQIYAENLRLLGNKLHGLKGSCGFLLQEAKNLCHRFEEITRPLADYQLVFTQTLAALLKQFVYKIEELLESLDTGNDSEQNIDDWLQKIDQTLATSRKFIDNQVDEFSRIVRERSVDNGEIRVRKQEEYLSVSLAGYESLAEKVKDLYYLLSVSLTQEQMVQTSSLFNQFLSTHQEIKKVPLVLTRYERLVPKMAKDYEKEAEFLFIDHKVKADREFWDAIHEILNHMIKNAVIHGVETPNLRKAAGKNPTGKVTVELKEDALHLLLTVADDGKGIAMDEVGKKAVEKGIITAQQLAEMNRDDLFDLLSLPGVSTVENLDDNAGRGIGMNAVKEVMLQQQGECKLTSIPGQGSQWQFSFLKKNVSLACIVVSTGDISLALPEDYVETFLDYREQDRQTVRQTPVYRFNGGLIPLLDSVRLFACNLSDLKKKNRSIVVLKYAGHHRGLIINRILHHAVQPILSLPTIYRDVPIYQGITFYNNEPVPVVNIAKLF